MSYRSKRTRAQLMEADGPMSPVTTPSLTTQSGATDATDDRWGPFCPQKNKVAAFVKAPQQQPSLKDCRPDANIDEPYATKAPFSKTQVNPTFEKTPNGPSSRIQISNSFQGHVAKPDQALTPNPILSKTHATANSRDLAATKARELSAKQIDASQKTGEQAQLGGVKPSGTLWKNSTSFTTTPLASKTHITANSHDVAATKARELSAKQIDASQKKGEQAQLGGVKPSGTLWKNSSFTTTPLVSKTHVTVNSHDLAARKARELSAKQLDASKKRAAQAQVGGVKPAGTFSEKFTKKSDGSFTTNPLLSKTHVPGNSYELVARKSQELSAKQPDASQKTGKEAQVGGVKPPDPLWKTSTTNDCSFTTNQVHSITHATRNLHDCGNRKAPQLSTKQPDASQKLGGQAQVGQSDVLWKNSPTNSSRVLTLKSTSSSVKPALLSMFQTTCRPPLSELVGKINNGCNRSNTIEKSSVEHEEVLNEQDANVARLKTFKPKRRSVVHNWPDNVEFDESEEVLFIDEEGKIEKVIDPVQPHDVWCAKGRYCVSFNEFYQPLKKGGHILVKFIGNMARKEKFCPIRDTNWHRVPDIFKVEIVKCIRDHFVIPDGDGYDKGILKRVGNSVRQYRHDLKKTFFTPTKKTKQEIYQTVPAGIPFDSWIHLVDYWYSEKGKKFSECGKEARASQNHVHTTGSTSYANIRAEFEEKNKRAPTELEVFKQTHKRKDGSYVKDTITEEFVLDADTYVQSTLATNPTKPKALIQNEAFSKLMYGEDIPKRPLGYGFGVKGSDVFGVHGILKKEAVERKHVENVQNMEEAVLSLTKDNEELQTKLNETNSILYKILEGMSSGMSPPDIAQLAKSSLNSQISDSSNGGGASG